MLNYKLLGKMAANRLINPQKYRNVKRKKHAIKRKHTEQMIGMFGKTRYYLSWWLGPWVLYAGNKKFYEPQPVPVKVAEEKPYVKFYKDEKIAKQYEKKLKEKYNYVSISPVYGEDKSQAGFVLCGRGKLSPG